MAEEIYRHIFHSVTKKTDESNKEFVARLDDLASKWLNSCKSTAVVKDRIAISGNATRRNQSFYWRMEASIK